MITKNNIKEVLASITPSDIRLAIDEVGDFILLELYVSNVGFSAAIRSLDYDEEVEQEAADSGNLFIDKDEFERLAGELSIEY